MPFEVPTREQSGRAACSQMKLKEPKPMFTDDYREAIDATENEQSIAKRKESKVIHAEEPISVLVW